VISGGSTAFRIGVDAYRERGRTVIVEGVEAVAQNCVQEAGATGAAAVAKGPAGMARYAARLKSLSFGVLRRAGPF
jgi:hypothetical protein